MSVQLPAPCCSLSEVMSGPACRPRTLPTKSSVSLPAASPLLLSPAYWCTLRLTESFSDSALLPSWLANPLLPTNLSRLFPALVGFLESFIALLVPLVLVPILLEQMQQDFSSQ